jgi:glutaredoxin-related protein
MFFMVLRANVRIIFELSKKSGRKVMFFGKLCYFCIRFLNFYAMNQVTLFIFAVLAIVVVLVVFSYLHKRHVEYKMVDIENAVRSAYSEGVTSVEKEALVKAVKKYFHCSSKEAHYIIGVARRKKIIDIAVGKVSLHQDS